MRHGRGAVGVVSSLWAERGIAAGLRARGSGCDTIRALMTRVVAAAGLLLAVACNALAWSLPFGGPSGNRTARGTGTFPRWQALALATEVPIKWLVALPGRRLATVDRDGALALFEVGSSGLRLVARYGGVASPAGPPVAVRLDQEQTGVVLVAPDGRLLVWSDGVLRGYDVGGPLSSATCPTPITFDGRVSQDLLAVAQDGAVVLIAGLAGGGPRAVARVDARALRDARITVADLDGDGASEAVVLSDAADRHPPGALGERIEGTSLAVIRVRPYSLELRARFTLSPPAVFEDLVPVLAPIAGSARPVVLVARRRRDRRWRRWRSGCATAASSCSRKDRALARPRAGCTWWARPI